MRLVCALLLALAASSASMPATAQTRQPAEAPSWPTLERFSSEPEFYQYLRDVRTAERRARGASLQKQNTEECPPELFPCAEEASDIVVTGSRIPAPSAAAASPAISGQTSITNVQNAGVDEGD